MCLGAIIVTFPYSLACVALRRLSTLSGPLKKLHVLFIELHNLTACLIEL